MSGNNHSAIKAAKELKKIGMSPVAIVDGSEVSQYADILQLTRQNAQLQIEVERLKSTCEIARLVSAQKDERMESLQREVTIARQQFAELDGRFIKLQEERDELRHMISKAGGQEKQQQEEASLALIAQLMKDGAIAAPVPEDQKKKDEDASIALIAKLQALGEIDGAPAPQ